MAGFTNLKGKAAVVTGGASGIGKGIASRLISEGMHVVIADIEEETLAETAAELGAVGIRTDVSDPESVQALAEAACDRFGTVHVVCNNAGVGPMAKIADLTRQDWQWMLDVNLWGVIHGVHTFLPVLQANPDGGHIVNTASVGGLSTMPMLGAYTVTKFGIVALTETLAQELEADGSAVGATVLCPGTVRTNIKNSSRNRPSALSDGRLADVDLADSDLPIRWLESEEVGGVVVDAIKRGDLYAITHPESFAAVEPRHQAIAAAFQRAPAQGQG